MKLRYPTSVELLAIDSDDDREGPCIQLLCWGCRYFVLSNGKDATDGARCTADAASSPMRDARTLKSCPFLGKPIMQDKAMREARK